MRRREGRRVRKERVKRIGEREREGEKGAEGKGDKRTKRYSVIIMTGVEVSPSRRAIAPNCIGKSERLQR